MRNNSLAGAVTKEYSKASSCPGRSTAPPQRGELAFRPLAPTADLTRHCSSPPSRLAMDAVAFPPPPAPFLDDDLDFGDFAFASPAADPLPHLPAAAADANFAAFDDDWGDFVASRLGSSPDGGSTTATATDVAPAAAEKPSWERPRGPLPLSLFGADDEEEGPAETPTPPPPPPATDLYRATHTSADGSRPGDLKDLIAGLYGSQPLSSPDAAEVGSVAEEDGDGFGDDGWEFKAAPSASDAGQDGGALAHGDVTEDISKSMSSNQDDWSLFTNINENLNHVQTTDHVETRESTGQSVKAFSYFPPNNASILDLYKESEPIDVVHMMQSSSESVQSSSDMFSNTEMLREESLTVISQYKNDFKEDQKSSMLSDEKNEATEAEREIQEICKELHNSSLEKGCKEEHPSKDVCISELLKSAKEDHLKDFDQEYHLTETIAMALEDMSSAVKLYKHSMSILHTLELASKEEQCDYVSAWYSMLLSCAQELQHGAMLWQESCHANVSDTVISQGSVTLNDEQLGLRTALAMVVDSNNLDEPVAKALLQSINNINEIEVANLQSSLPNNKMACKLTLLPTSLVPGMEVVIWDDDHYFVKVANLWANRISPDPPRFSVTPIA
uniref:Hypothetical_protein n=1 Tax=Oryza brachyantha TaxID=4533 RepID=G2XM92_ORYBR|nr:hypothetical_protein [Oryza brachyantha]